MGNILGRCSERTGASGFPGLTGHSPLHFAPGEMLQEDQGFRLFWAGGTKSPALCTMTLFHSAPQLLRKFPKQGALYQSRKLQPLRHCCSRGVNQKPLSTTRGAFNEMLT